MCTVEFDFCEHTLVWLDMKNLNAGDDRVAIVTKPTRAACVEWLKEQAVTLKKECEEKMTKGSVHSRVLHFFRDPVGGVYFRFMSRWSHSNVPGVKHYGLVERTSDAIESAQHKLDSNESAEFKLIHWLDSQICALETKS